MAGVAHEINNWRVNIASEPRNGVFCGLLNQALMDLASNAIDATVGEGTIAIAQGTVLGLSITYSTAQRHPGTLRLAAAAGGGTVATLRFPLKRVGTLLRRVPKSRRPHASQDGALAPQGAPSPTLGFDPASSGQELALDEWTKKNSGARSGARWCCERAWSHV